MAKTIPEFKGTIAFGLSSKTSSKSASESRKGQSFIVHGERSSIKDSRRHEESERKRLESIKRQRETYAQKQSAISSALKSIDHCTLGAAINKKIKFSSSSSSDESSDECTEAHAAKQPATPSAITNGRQKLFDDEDDEDVVVDFGFKTQKFDGTVGAKLLELQSRYGGADQRFKLDARFLDDDTESTKGKSDHKEDEDSLCLREERHANIRILEKVLGKPVEKDMSESPKKSKTVPYLRYDPENPAHRRFQVLNDDQETAADESMPSSSSSGESEEDEAEEMKAQPVPVGLDIEFAERLRKDQASAGKLANGDVAESGFSLRKLFGRDEPETSGASKNNSTSAVSLPTWQRSLTHTHELSSEDEPEEKSGAVLESATRPKNQANKIKKKLAARQSLFFFYDEKDERILHEGEKFRRLEDMDTMRARWEKQRDGLIQFYKSRRKEALKKQRLRKEKEAIGKSKQSEKPASFAKKQRNMTS